jgi:hypothetical protein
MKPDYANKLFCLTCFLTLSFLFGACGINKVGVKIGEPQMTKKGGPPPHAPAHGYRAKYAYRYYPRAHTYFDISRKLYFYLVGDKWKVSASLPGHLQVRLGDYVNVEMDSDKPYLNYEEHKKKYPPGQLKKKEKWIKKKR